MTPTRLSCSTISMRREFAVINKIRRRKTGTGPLHCSQSSPLSICADVALSAARNFELYYCTPYRVNSSPIFAWIVFAAEISISLPALSPFLSLASPRPIERTCQLWLESQCRIIIVDGSVELAHLHVGQPTRVIRRGIVRLRLKRLIAVLDRRLQLTKAGAGPTASVPCGFQIGLKPNCLVIVAGRAIVLVLFPVGFGTVDERLGVVGI